MVFSSKCATSEKHKEWGISGDQPLRQLKDRAIVKCLLDQVNKTISKHFSKTKPKFCHGCIEHIVEIRPELFQEHKTGQSEHSYSTPSTSGDVEEPDRKKARITETTEVHGEPLVQISNKDVCVQTDEIHIICENNHLSGLPRYIINNLAYNIGKLLNIELQKDLAALSAKESKTVSALMDLNVEQYKIDRNNILMSFVHGVSGRSCGPRRVEDDTPGEGVIGEGSQQQKLDYRICKTVESIINLTGVYTVFPMHLRESILIQSIGCMALSLQILASNSPFATYNTVRNWMDKLGTNAPMTLSGDVISVFDNNQTMQRRWRVQLDNKVFCNVVTVVAFFQMNDKGVLQSRSDMKPGLWLLKDRSPQEKENIKYIDQMPAVKETHCNDHLYPYWTNMMADVIKDQKQKRDGDGLGYRDSVDDYLESKLNMENFKKCYDCGLVKIDRNKIVCPQYKTNLKSSKLRHMGLTDKSTYKEKKKQSRESNPKHYRLNVSQEKGQCSVSYDEISPQADCVPVNKVNPVFVNPCSYDAVLSVLRHIGDKSGIAKYNSGEGIREGIPVYCDGSPYNLCFRIVMSTYECNTCGSTECGVEAIGKHIHAEHSKPLNNITPDLYQLEFDWVLLQPGPGHLEMNMVKGITDLCWEVFWKDLASSMNFKSEKALLCCTKVTDHHKVGVCMSNTVHDIRFLQQ